MKRGQATRQTTKGTLAILTIAFVLVLGVVIFAIAQKPQAGCGSSVTGKFFWPWPWNKEKPCVMKTEMSVDEPGEKVKYCEEATCAVDEGFECYLVKKKNWLGKSYPACICEEEYVYDADTACRFVYHPSIRDGFCEGDCPPGMICKEKTYTHAPPNSCYCDWDY